MWPRLSPAGLKIEKKRKDLFLDIVGGGGGVQWFEFRINESTGIRK